MEFGARVSLNELQAITAPTSLTMFRWAWHFAGARSSKRNESCSLPVRSSRLPRDGHDVRERLWVHQPWRGKAGCKAGFLEEVMAKNVLKDEKESSRGRGCTPDVGEH